jgi:CO dehydrogenase/acetyl-CoA synthase alpha subunit
VASASVSASACVANGGAALGSASIDARSKLHTNRYMVAPYMKREINARKVQIGTAGFYSYRYNAAALGVLRWGLQIVNVL